MKKFTLGMLTAVLMASACYAQSGFDAFGGFRTVIVAPAKNMDGSTVGITNGAIDVRPFTGMVNLDLLAVTNNAATTFTLKVQTSPDAATWTDLGSIANATVTTAIWTNTYYGTNLYVTNSFLLPGTIVTPTAATAGFATPYLLPAQYTNSGAITYAGFGMHLGFNASDAQRYIRTVIIPGGTTTNATVFGILTGKWTPTNIIP
jgi:hypothetical protein